MGMKNRDGSSTSVVRYVQGRLPVGDGQLTDAERAELAACETILEAGVDVLVQVGRALATIRDKRLYREQFATFENYCQQRWQIGRAYAYRLIGASQVIGNLSPIGDKLPLNEAQARPLSPLEPEQQRLVWEVVRQTAPDGKVTASHVKSVVNVFREMLVTGALDDGSGEQIAISQVAKAAIVEEAYERMKRQEAYVAEWQRRAAQRAGSSVEWYTPLEIVERVRRALGHIA